jgi:site-specific DNA recombinase
MSIAVYMRVSTEDQAERGTIEAQRDYAEKYLDLHGVTATYYAEDGFTGTLPLSDRPVGKQLMDDIAAGKIKEVLVYKIDRFGRNTRVILNSVYELEQAGAVIKSMTEPFDTSTPTGRFMLSIIASAAALDRDNTVERLWHGANRCAKEDGRWLGGIVPYGYRSVDKFLQIDETEADVVQMMYEKVAGGMSCVKLADYLNANNIPTAYTNGHGKRKIGTSGIWTPGRVRNLLVSTIYYGQHAYGKRTNKEREPVIRAMPAIVSKELWQQCQDQIAENRIIDPHNRKNEYLLRGLIKCGECGLNFSGWNFKSKHYYRCNGKSKYRGPIVGTCTSPNLPIAFIEDKVWARVKGFIENPREEIEKLRPDAEGNRKKLAALENEKKALLSAITSKASEREVVIDLARRKLITPAEVETQLEKMGKEKALLESKVAALNKEISDVELSITDYSAIEALAARSKDMLNTATFDEKRQLIKLFVSSIEVSRNADNTPCIKANYKIIAPDRTDKDSLPGPA